MRRSIARTWAAALLLPLAASPAFAHTGEGISGGFLGGFEHPLLGPDHVVAMVAVGLWGAFLGAPAIWMLPVVFPLVMAFGGALGILCQALVVEQADAARALWYSVQVASGRTTPHAEVLLGPLGPRAEPGAHTFPPSVAQTSQVAEICDS